MSAPMEIYKRAFLLAARNGAGLTRMYSAAAAGGGKNTTQQPPKPQEKPAAAKPAPAAPKEDGSKYCAQEYYQHGAMSYNDYEITMRPFRLEQPSAL